MGFLRRPVAAKLTEFESKARSARIGHDRWADRDWVEYDSCGGCGIVERVTYHGEDLDQLTVTLSNRDGDPYPPLAIIESALRAGGFDVHVADNSHQREIYFHIPDRPMRPTLEKLDRAIAAIPEARIDFHFQNIAEHVKDTIDAAFTPAATHRFEMPRKSRVGLPEGVSLRNDIYGLTADARKLFVQALTAELMRPAGDASSPTSSGEQVSELEIRMSKLAKIAAKRVMKEWDHLKHGSPLFLHYPLPALNEPVIHRLAEKVDAMLSDGVARQQTGFTSRGRRNHGDHTRFR